MGVTLFLGCLLGRFYCILDFMWVLGVVGMLFLVGFLVELLMCILHVYLRAPFAFLMKFSYLLKKKKIMSLSSKATYAMLPLS
jgi:hypothetical protein